MTVRLGGSVIDDSGRRYLPIIDEPTESQVDEIISLYATYEGILEISHQPEPALGPYRLTLYAEKEGVLLKNGKWLYLLLLGQYEPNGDVRVRTIDNKEFEPGLAIHWGDYYPSRARTRDLELVRHVFKEFARTGNVSEDIMS